MTDIDPYNELVRACFENPDHAGDLGGDYAETLEADLTQAADGTRLMLSAGVADGTVSQMRFRAWGCPHFLAAAELLCREKEAGPVDSLSRFDLNAMMQRLSVPVEKTGKLLLLEDALKLLWAQHVAAA